MREKAASKFETMDTKADSMDEFYNLPSIKALMNIDRIAYFLSIGRQDNGLCLMKCNFPYPDEIARPEDCEPFMEPLEEEAD